MGPKIVASTIPNVGNIIYIYRPYRSPSIMGNRYGTHDKRRSGTPCASLLLIKSCEVLVLVVFEEDLEKEPEEDKVAVDDDDNSPRSVT